MVVTFKRGTTARPSPVWGNPDSVSKPFRSPDPTVNQRGMNVAVNSATDKNGTPQPMTVAEIAAVCHEANRAYCWTQNDDSQKPWEDAPAWQRASAILGVQQVQNNPDISAEALHESWLKEKTDEGWTYGEVKDPIKKEHPCFVPYDQLPAFQRRKDALFRAVAIALLKG